MRKFFAAVVVLLAFSMTLSPASALEVWQGDVVVTSVTPACTNSASPRKSIEVGSILRSVLRPKLVSNNGNDTRISFFHDLQAVYATILAGGAMPEGTMTTFGVSHEGKLITNIGSTYTSYVQTPTTVTSAATFVTLTIRMQNFLFIPGCRAGLRGVYSKRVG